MLLPKLQIPEETNSPPLSFSPSSPLLLFTTIACRLSKQSGRYVWDSLTFHPCEAMRRSNRTRNGGETDLPPSLFLSLSSSLPWRSIRCQLDAISERCPGNSPTVVGSYVFNNPLNIAALPTERAGIKPMRIELFDFLLFRAEPSKLARVQLRITMIACGSRRTIHATAHTRLAFGYSYHIVRKLRSIMT